MEKLIKKMETIPNAILRNLVVTLFIMFVNPLSITVYMMFICELIYKYLP